MRTLKLLGAVATLLVAASCTLNRNAFEKRIPAGNSDFWDIWKNYRHNIAVPKFLNIDSSEEISLGNALNENARIIIDSVIMDNEDDEEDSLQQDAMISYDIKENNFGILSIVLDSYLYQGDGNPIGYIESYNLSKKTLKLLEFDDIFISGSEEYFKKYIEHAISQYSNLKVLPRASLDEKKREPIPFSEMKFKVKLAVLYFEGDEVVFAYPAYEIVGSAYKMIVFRIKKEEIIDYIR